MQETGRGTGKTLIWLIPCVIVLSAAILLMMGRGPWCECGFVRGWYGTGPENSQHLSDWYTLSHIIHGFLFYGGIQLLARARGRPIPFVCGLALAVTLECAWEIVENTDFVIARYRTATASFDYAGDSVVNSVSDIVAMMLGFLLAARLPVAVVVALAIVMEGIAGYAIHDNLVLNIVMLLHPSETIRAWQMPVTGLP